MGRGAGGYVNLLSHSPVDTPCPGYRYRESRNNLLNEAAPLVATTPPALRDNAERSPDVLCPVQIHVHDPTIRERRRRPRGNRVEKRHRGIVEDRSKRWIDLDENVLDGYILIDDGNLGPSVPDIDSEELPYPEDAIEYDDDNDDDDDNPENIGSHGRREWSIYKRSKKSVSKRYQSDFDFGASYPLANSHGNAYQDSSSHSKYTEVYSEFQSAKNNLDTTRDLDAIMPYAMANSHGEHGDPAADIRNRYRESSESDNLTWDVRPTDVNYEIANSHSNYRVFYDSQTQYQAMMPPWTSEAWSVNHSESHVTSSEDPKVNIQRKQDNEKCEAHTNDSEKKDEQESGTTCDIEQCLIQIEESLLNIEQNLLHVQDLDIPELRNLLYKSPSIERSLYEVQDLLYADGIVPVITRNKSMSLDSDEEQEEEDEDEEVEEEEVWVGQSITIKDNDDEDGNASAPLLNSSNEGSSDTTNINEHNSSRSTDGHYTDWIDGSSVLQEEMRDPSLQINPEKMNFVPNSLSKTLPRRIVLDEVKDNIRLCSSEPEEPTIMIDYNLNSACAEKKSLFRDKWHSRTNSLDENSIFQNQEFGDTQENDKSSLQDIFLESAGNRRLATLNAKAQSEGMLQAGQAKRRDRRGSHEEKLLQAVEATAEDFRKKLESFASQRRSILADRQKRMLPKSAKEVSDDAMLQSKEKSPAKSKRATTTTAKTQDRDNSACKNVGCDKRKRKKASGKSQGTSDNALVPSKLISLSLSLLLAALLQAVRCLTDLVEDAFRSVSYDRSGLLQ